MLLGNCNIICEVAERAAAQDFVDRSNELIDEGAQFTRQSLSKALRRQASKAATRFRDTMVAFGFDMHGYNAGHVPDTTWTCVAEPPDWRALPESVNRSFGKQAQDYDIGYQVTRFFLDW